MLRSGFIRTVRTVSLPKRVALPVSSSARASNRSRSDQEVEVAGALDGGVLHQLGPDGAVLRARSRTATRRSVSPSM